MDPLGRINKNRRAVYILTGNQTCLVTEPDKVLVGELNEWVANPLGPGQTSALQIKTRSA